MMIEEKIAHSILHQQKDVIAKHLGQIRETMRENHTREDLLVKNEHSPLLGRYGINVRLSYDKRCRSWGVYRGIEVSKEDWRNWVGYGFLSYDAIVTRGNLRVSNDLIELAEELIENCIADAIQEYQQESGYEVEEEEYA